jgi:hypothetical protein
VRTSRGTPAVFVHLPHRNRSQPTLSRSALPWHDQPFPEFIAKPLQKPRREAQPSHAGANGRIPRGRPACRPATTA